MADLPTTPAPSNIKIESIHQTFTAMSQNLQVYKSTRGGHRWRFTLEYPPMQRAEFAPLWAFLISQKGKFEEFGFTLPNHTPLGNLSKSGTYVQVKTALSSGRSLETKGWTADTNGVLKAGDFFSFENTDKTYMVTSDVNADSSGEATINFEPSLLTSVGEDANLTFDGKFNVSLNEDNTSVEFNVHQHYGIDIILIEVCNG